MDELTREFLIESQEGLDRMERCLTELEERPQDTALLAEIFRSVHTIKGTTGFLGFKRLEKLAHAGENLLGLLREGKLKATPPVITALLELLDALRSILKAIESDGGEGKGEDAALIAQLEKMRTPAQPVPKQPAQEEAPATQTTVIRSQAVRSRKQAPPAAKLAVVPARDAAEAKKKQTKPESAPQPAIAVPQISAPAVEEKMEAATVAPAMGEGEGHKARPLLSAAAESTLRVDVTLLNRMMNLVGELVLTRNQILQATASDPSMTQLSRRLDMVTADLRESVMKARMQPVSNIFSKMPRMVRDLCQALGRRVRLQMEGQETELDKSLLEAIKDPLTHAVRNSLDHGIEPPEARAAAGKDAEGTLKLRASHEGSHVVVEVQDDGAGIDVEKVRRKAIERGAVTAVRSAQLGERELLQLIFLPGLSTAAKVTNVSGRGVGMDVVRTNVERIGGKVEIDSKPGQGTTLRMRIPLTLAIIPALIVRSLDQSFALPQGSLSELVHIPPEQAQREIEWMEEAPLYRLRGRLLPLVFLGGLLKPGADCGLVKQRDNFIAVLDAEGRRFGLVVDGLADPEEIVVKPLSAVLKDIGIYSGATVLGNGELALILDPGSIAMRAGIAMSAKEETANAAEGVEQEQSSRIEYLLVEAAGRPAAVPLGDVLRIEQLPLGRIEYVGYRPVLNFEGQLLPIEDAGGVLGSPDSAAGSGERQIIVVVCRDGNRHVGITVSHVLDVAAGGDLFEAGTRQQAGGVTLLKNRVTGVVNLGGVPPLETASPAQTDWSQPVEAAG